MCSQYVKYSPPSTNTRICPLLVRKPQPYPEYLGARVCVQCRYVSPQNCHLNASLTQPHLLKHGLDDVPLHDLVQTPPLPPVVASAAPSAAAITAAAAAPTAAAPAMVVPAVTSDQKSLKCPQLTLHPVSPARERT